MDKNGKITAEIKVLRIPYLYIEFNLERDENINWSFTLKVHCMDNQNHVHLQEIRKQVRTDLVETVSGSHSHSSVADKLAAVSKYLTETAYTNVKQRIRINEEISTDKHLIPFEYN